MVNTILSAFYGLKLKQKDKMSLWFEKDLSILSYWHAMQIQIATGSWNLSSDFRRIKLVLADESYIWNTRWKTVFLWHLKMSKMVYYSDLIDYIVTIPAYLSLKCGHTMDPPFDQDTQLIWPTLRARTNNGRGLGGCS